ncbi:MAG: GNAT family N-acetyltransferase [Minisyncoccota bacterium]
MYKIRLVKKNDLEALSETFSRSFTAADKSKPWTKQRAHDYLFYWLKKQPDMFFGAFNEKGQPIGAMAVNIKPWRTGTRCSDGVIFVDTEYQRQGIAKSLFKKVIEKAVRKYDATGFEAITFAGEEFPLSWYKRIDINVDEHAVLIKGNCVDILAKLLE